MTQVTAGPAAISTRRPELLRAERLAALRKLLLGIIPTLIGLVISAASQGIPNSYLEAATIDGANGWQKFRYIVLPELTYPLTVVGILALIWNMNDLITVWGATQGGPADSSQILSTWIYTMGFTSFRFGLSSALSVINFLILLAASVAYLLVLRRTWGEKER